MGWGERCVRVLGRAFWARRSIAATWVRLWLEARAAAWRASGRIAVICIEIVSASSA